eukprot:TRINITY_DN16401_c0_g1_i1.p1 TRINITY_DN16401_c0_g1~~TRINITY_DN16401_c0_g1_i1.p1  ORF type:complete len:638 (+),score=188.69 TRINITY_DN16401_c0_g1_i1:76-1914(+)
MPDRKGARRSSAQGRGGVPGATTQQSDQLLTAAPAPPAPSPLAAAGVGRQPSALQPSPPAPPGGAQSPAQTDPPAPPQHRDQHRGRLRRCVCGATLPSDAKYCRRCQRGADPASQGDKKQDDHAALRQRLLDRVRSSGEELRRRLCAARAATAVLPSTDLRHASTHAGDTRLEDAALALDAAMGRFDDFINSAMGAVTDALAIADLYAGQQKQPLAPQQQATAALQQQAASGAGGGGGQGGGGATSRGGAAGRRDDTPQQHLHAAAHFLLEALAWDTQAEKATLLLHHPAHDELVSVAVVGSRELNTRLPAGRGLAGQVFRSGIAMNYAPGGDVVAPPDEPPPPAGERPSTGSGAMRQRGMLCLPVPPLSGAGDNAGVIQVMHKRKGGEAFTTCDEGTAHAASRLLAYILRRYPMSWGCPAYDASPLYSVVPWDSPGPSPGLLPGPMGANGMRQLVYRTAQLSGEYVRKKQRQEAVGLGPCASILEVDTFIRNLEDCWRRSVEACVDFEHEREERLAHIRTLRHDGRMMAQRITALEETLRVQQVEMDDCRTQNDELSEALRNAGLGGAEGPPATPAPRRCGATPARRTLLPSRSPPLSVLQRERRHSSVCR